MRYIPTTLELHRHMTKVLVPKQKKEGVDMIINAKDTYHIVTARREMTEEKYEESYVIIDSGESDGLC